MIGEGQRGRVLLLREFVCRRVIAGVVEVAANAKNAFQDRFIFLALATAHSSLC